MSTPSETGRAGDSGSVRAFVETLDDESLYAGDPFPLYARLRREAPVAWNARTGYWAVSRHADVVAVSRDSERFCSGKGILTFEIGARVMPQPRRPLRPHRAVCRRERGFQALIVVETFVQVLNLRSEIADLVDRLM